MYRRNQGSKEALVKLHFVVPTNVKGEQLGTLAILKGSFSLVDLAVRGGDGLNGLGGCSDAYGHGGLVEFLGRTGK